jgi:hypothetical protein
MNVCGATKQSVNAGGGSKNDNDTLPILLVLTTVFVFSSFAGCSNYMIDFTTYTITIYWFRQSMVHADENDNQRVMISTNCDFASGRAKYSGKLDVGLKGNMSSLSPSNRHKYLYIYINTFISSNV